MAAEPYYSAFLGHLAYEGSYSSISITGSKKATANINDLLPGFPSGYIGDRVWTGVDMASKEHEFIIKLSDQDLVYVTDALKHFQSGY